MMTLFTGMSISLDSYGLQISLGVIFLPKLGLSNQKPTMDVDDQVETTSPTQPPPITLYHDVLNPMHPVEA